ncbi:type VI secretion system lipoprotein TssJ [Neptunicella marina]|uniref:Type VI secretion system lipoprotein TssJ n=1 Tax=Neptunicella marina TaxID=2125989 RepID=A0A8J6M2T4_9ALTE|nr:type VI secretion system lipoprotein TssJ [Neptunicella marina]MBC3766688.1 type VI secretion system lipoprotein TssJ [Neptunicella marina]
MLQGLYLKAFRQLAAGMLMLLLCACGATNAVKDVFSVMTHVDLNIQVANDINPDIDGRPSPVLVRIFELKAVNNFNNADFFSLYGNGAAILAQDYISHFDLELVPGQSSELSRELNEQTQYLAVMAAFRDINNASWKRTVLIEPDSSTDIQIQLKGTQITLSSE